MQYLVQRGNTYSFRRGIPAAIRHVIRKGTHYVVSLGTADLQSAKRECLQVSAQVQDEFDRAFAQLPKSITPSRPVSEPQASIEETIRLIEDVISDREHRAFHAAIQNPDRAGRLANMRKALLARPQEPDESDTAEKLFVNHLAERGYAVAPGSPAHAVGVSRFRKSLAASLDHATAWSTGDFLPA